MGSATEQHPLLLGGIQCPAHRDFTRVDVFFEPAVPAEEPFSLFTSLHSPAAGIPVVSALTGTSPVVGEVRACSGWHDLSSYLQENLPFGFYVGKLSKNSSAITGQ